MGDAMANGRVLSVHSSITVFVSVKVEVTVNIYVTAAVVVVVAVTVTESISAPASSAFEKGTFETSTQASYIK